MKERLIFSVFLMKILLNFKTIVNIELTWENDLSRAKSVSTRLLIGSAKQFNLIMTSFNSIVFNKNLNKLLKLNASLFVLIWLVCLNIKKINQQHKMVAKP